MRRWVPLCVTCGAALTAAVLLQAWLVHVPPMPEERRPTREGSIAESRVPHSTEAINIEGALYKFPREPVRPSSSWPQFRGPGRANLAVMNGPLLETWPTNGPLVLWSTNLCEGHAAPAVWNGRVYILDYNAVRKGDVLRCFALDSGKEL